MRRQSKKAQSIISDVDIVKQTASVKKREKRTEYNKLYREKQRQDFAFKANEFIKERTCIKNKRKNPAFKANEIISKRTDMQNKRKDPAFKAKEIVNERAYIQNKRSCL